MSKSVRQKFSDMESEIASEVMVERDDAVRLGMLGLLTGRSVFYLGPAGTGKSYLCDAFVNRIKGGKVFKHLMAQTTTVSDVFGPQSLAAMRKDISRISTSVTDPDTGESYSYLTDCEVVFLDEVFKCNSAVLNNMLGCLNEKIFTNGCTVQPVKNVLMVTASNEVPTGEAMKPLFDRFVLRCVVNYIDDPDNMVKILKKANRSPDDVDAFVTLEEVEKAKGEWTGIAVPDDLFYRCHEVVMMARTRGFDPSDRATQWACEMAQATAWLEGRDTIVKGDLIMPLSCILWTKADEIETAAELVEESLIPIIKTAKKGLIGIRKAKRAFDGAGSDGGVSAKVEKTNQMVTVNEAVEMIEGLLDDCADDERAFVQKIYDESNGIYAKMLKRQNGK